MPIVRLLPLTPEEAEKIRAAKPSGPTAPARTSPPIMWGINSLAGGANRALGNTFGGAGNLVEKAFTPTPHDKANPFAHIDELKAGWTPEMIAQGEANSLGVAKTVAPPLKKLGEGFSQQGEAYSAQGMPGIAGKILQGFGSASVDLPRMAIFGPTGLIVDSTLMAMAHSDPMKKYNFLGHEVSGEAIDTIVSALKAAGLHVMLGSLGSLGSTVARPVGAAIMTGESLMSGAPLEDAIAAGVVGWKLTPQGRKGLGWGDMARDIQSAYRKTGTPPPTEGPAQGILPMEGADRLVAEREAEARFARDAEGRIDPGVPYEPPTLLGNWPEEARPMEPAPGPEAPVRPKGAVSPLIPEVPPTKPAANVDEYIELVRQNIKDPDLQARNLKNLSDNFDIVSVHGEGGARTGYIAKRYYTLLDNIIADLTGKTDDVSKHYLEWAKRMRELPQLDVDVEVSPGISEQIGTNDPNQVGVHVASTGRIVVDPASYAGQRLDFIENILHEGTHGALSHGSRMTSGEGPFESSAIDYDMGRMRYYYERAMGRAKTDAERSEVARLGYGQNDVKEYAVVAVEKNSLYELIQKAGFTKTQAREMSDAMSKRAMEMLLPRPASAWQNQPVPVVLKPKRPGVYEIKLPTAGRSLGEVPLDDTTDLAQYAAELGEELKPSMYAMTPEGLVLEGLKKASKAIDELQKKGVVFYSGAAEVLNKAWEKPKEEPLRRGSDEVPESRAKKTMYPEDISEMSKASRMAKWRKEKKQELVALEFSKELADATRRVTPAEEPVGIELSDGRIVSNPFMYGDMMSTYIKKLGYDPKDIVNVGLMRDGKLVPWEPKLMSKATRRALGYYRLFEPYTFPQKERFVREKPKGAKVWNFRGDNWIIDPNAPEPEWFKGSNWDSWIKEMEAQGDTEPNWAKGEPPPGYDEDPLGTIKKWEKKRFKTSLPDMYVDRNTDISFIAKASKDKEGKWIQPKLPGPDDSRSHLVIRMKDGTLFVDTKDEFAIHQQLAEALGVPASEVKDAGFFQFGEFRQAPYSMIAEWKAWQEDLEAHEAAAASDKKREEGGLLSNVMDRTETAAEQLARRRREFDTVVEAKRDEDLRLRNIIYSPKKGEIERAGMEGKTALSMKFDPEIDYRDEYADLLSRVGEETSRTYPPSKPTNEELYEVMKKEHPEWAKLPSGKTYDPKKDYGKILKEFSVLKKPDPNVKVFTPSFDRVLAEYEDSLGKKPESASLRLARERVKELFPDMKAGDPAAEQLAQTMAENAVADVKSGGKLPPGLKQDDIPAYVTREARNKVFYEAYKEAQANLWKKNKKSPGKFKDYNTTVDWEDYSLEIMERGLTEPQQEAVFKMADRASREAAMKLGIDVDKLPDGELPWQKVIMSDVYQGHMADYLKKLMGVGTADELHRALSGKDSDIDNLARASMKKREKEAPMPTKPAVMARFAGTFKSAEDIIKAVGGRGRYQIRLGFDPETIPATDVNRTLLDKVGLVKQSPEYTSLFEEVYKNAKPIPWDGVTEFKTEKSSWKLADMMVVKLTNNCQRANALSFYKEFGLAPSDWSIKPCYGFACWADRKAAALQYNLRAKGYESIAERGYQEASPEAIRKVWQSPAFLRDAKKTPFFRHGQTGDDSHSIHRGMAYEWLKAQREAGPPYDKIKNVFISAGYAPSTPADYAKLAPYKDQFVIHFSVSGWEGFPKGETLNRMNEFKMARDAGLDATFRVITNNDNLDARMSLNAAEKPPVSMANEKWLMDSLANAFGIEGEKGQFYILETPYHNDFLPHDVARSRAGLEFARECCKPLELSKDPTGKGIQCKTCAVRCMTKVGSEWRSEELRLDNPDIDSMSKPPKDRDELLKSRGKQIEEFIRRTSLTPEKAEQVRGLFEGDMADVFGPGLLGKKERKPVFGQKVPPVPSAPGVMFQKPEVPGAGEKGPNRWTPLPKRYGVKTVTEQALEDAGVEYHGTPDEPSSAAGVLKGQGTLPGFPERTYASMPPPDVVKFVARIEDPKRLPFADEIETPMRLLERVGGGKNNPLKDFIYRAPKAGEDASKAASELLKKELEDKFKSLGLKTNFEQSERLGRIMTQRQHLGKGILGEMGVKPVTDATPAELEAVKWMDERYLQAFHEVNAHREAAGQEPLTWRKDYSTFWHVAQNLESDGISLFNAPRETIERALDKAQEEYMRTRTPEQLAKERKRSSIFFRFAQQRSGKLGPIDLDQTNVFQKYMAASFNQMYQAEATAAAKKLIHGQWVINGKPYKMSTDQPYLYKQLSEYLGFITGGYKGDIPADLYRMGRAMASNAAVSKVGFNPRSVVSQLTSNVHTIVNLGKTPQYLLKAVAEDLDGVRQALMGDPSKLKFAQESGDIKWRFKDPIVDEVAKLRGRGLVLKGRAGAAKVGMYGLQFFDSITADLAWRANYDKAMDGKVPGIAKGDKYMARTFANEEVTRTQSSASKMDLTPLQRKQWGKIATTLQNFVINEWGFVTRDVMGIRNPVMKTPERIAKVVEFYVLCAIVDSLFEDVLGIRSPMNVLGSPSTIVRGVAEEKKKGSNTRKVIGRGLTEAAGSLPIVGRGLQYGSDMLGVVTDPVTQVKKVGTELTKKNATAADAAGPLVEAGGSMLGVPGAMPIAKAIEAWSRGAAPVPAFFGKPLPKHKTEAQKKRETFAESIKRKREEQAKKDEEAKKAAEGKK